MTQYMWQVEKFSKKLQFGKLMLYSIRISVFLSFDYTMLRKLGIATTSIPKQYEALQSLFSFQYQFIFVYSLEKEDLPKSLIGIA